MADQPKQSSFLGSLGSSLGSAFGSGLFGQMFGGMSARRQWKYQQKAMQLQQQYTLEQMQKQFDYQRAQFDYENAYNTPINVMNRYRAAGINPASVLGSSGASMSSTMPMPSSPSGASISPGSGVSPAGSVDMQNPALVKSQIDLNRSTASLNDSNADLADARVPTEDALRTYYGSLGTDAEASARLKDLDSVLKALEVDAAPERIDLQLERLRAEVDEITSSKNLNEQETSYLRACAFESAMRCLLYGSEIEKNDSLRIMIDNQAYYLSLQAKDLKETIDALKARQTRVQIVTYYKDEDGVVQRKPFWLTVDGYKARAVGQAYSALAAGNEFASSFVNADWANTRAWNEEIRGYTESATHAVQAVGNVITGAKKAGALQQIAETGASEASKTIESTNESYYNANGELQGYKHRTRQRR